MKVAGVERREDGSTAVRKVEGDLTYTGSPRPTEAVCEDCMDGDHEACRRQGGWMHQEDDDRCGCHDTGHRLDNRQRSDRPLAR